MSYFNREDAPQLSSFNYALKTVRISVEWNYGFTATEFRYLGNAEKFKLLNSKHVTKAYTVATLLRNCFVGLYGCQTSNYFNIVPPQDFLQKYLMQENW